MKYIINYSIKRQGQAETFNSTISPMDLDECMQVLKSWGVIDKAMGQERKTELVEVSEYAV